MAEMAKYLAVFAFLAFLLFLAYLALADGTSNSCFFCDQAHQSSPSSSHVSTCACAVHASSASMKTKKDSAHKSKPVAPPVVATASSTQVRRMGTDIDHGAGSVDWSAVKSTGTGWSYCKVSGGFSNAGYDFKDPMFATYWPQLKQTGLARGAYCFFDLTADGTKQAKLFLELLDEAGGLEADDLPPVLDIEWTPDRRHAPKPSPEQWHPEALKWLEYIEQQTGRIPMIYTGLSMAQNDFDSSFAKYPLWVARYPTLNEIQPTLNPYPNYAPQNVGPWKGWTIWQYSETGNIAGIGPGQDLDILAGTVEDLVRATTLK